MRVLVHAAALSNLYQSTNLHNTWNYLLGVLLGVGGEPVPGFAVGALGVEGEGVEGEEGGVGAELLVFSLMNGLLVRAEG